MSAISADWAPTETATPESRAAKRSREDEFHSALESYIANYQKRHAAPVEVAGGRKSVSNFWFLPRLTNWSRGLSPGRRNVVVSFMVAAASTIATRNNHSTSRPDVAGR
jgi:hypothetical protein